MGIFKKKKQTSTENMLDSIKITHTHTWKDMPWYMRTWYNTDECTAGYQIVEPFICVTCGERKNVELEKTEWRGISYSEREKFFKEIEEKYKEYLKPRAVVEDMINNILLVKDAHRLNMIEKIYGLPHQNVGTSAEMNQEKESDFKIKLPKRC